MEMLVGGPVGASVGLGLFLSLRSLKWQRALDPLAESPKRVIRLPIAGSILEELVWRGIVLHLLRAYVALPLSLAAATVGFAIAHFDSQHWRGVAVHTITGLSFAGVLIATGTVISAVAAHVAYNLLISHHRNGIAEARSNA